MQKKINYTDSFLIIDILTSFVCAILFFLFSLLYLTQELIATHQIHIGDVNIAKITVSKNDSPNVIINNTEIIEINNCTYQSSSLKNF